MKFLREPLVQFLLLGAALFGVFGLIGKWTSGRPGQIVVTPGLIENFTVSYTRNSQRPPTPQELDALIEDYIREEVFCREAKSLGLDQDDPIVRRRLRQRMEFFTEESAEMPPPSEDELQLFLQQNANTFKRPDGGVPELAEVRETVQRAWLAARRKEAGEAAYRKLRTRYTVVIERPKAGGDKTPASAGTNAAAKAK